MPCTCGLLASSYSQKLPKPRTFSSLPPFLAFPPCLGYVMRLNLCESRQIPQEPYIKTWHKHKQYAMISLPNINTKQTNKRQPSKKKRYQLPESSFARASTVQVSPESCFIFPYDDHHRQLPDIDVYTNALVLVIVDIHLLHRALLVQFVALETYDHRFRIRDAVLFAEIRNEG